MAKLFFGGDVVNCRNTEGAICTAGIKEWIASSDFAMVNLEAPVVSSGKPMRKTGPSIQQLPATIGGLSAAGFDAVGIANNHMMDFGETGLQATLDLTLLHGLGCVGAGLSVQDAWKPLLVESADVRVGIVAACEAQYGVLDGSCDVAGPGVAWINDPRLLVSIGRLRRECHRVVVIAHAGLEHVSVPQQGWRSCYRRICEAGADAVIGSHPHVPQGYERWGDSVIFYSLGNFYFDSVSLSRTGDRSFSVALEMERQGDIGIEVFQHMKAGNEVRPTPSEIALDIGELNAMLGDGYEARADAVALDAYRRLRPLLSAAFTRTLPLDEPVFLAKSAVKRVLGLRGQREGEMTAMHLLRNESYRFAIERSLRILAGPPKFL